MASPGPHPRHILHGKRNRNQETQMAAGRGRNRESDGQGLQNLRKCSLPSYFIINTAYRGVRGARYSVHLLFASLYNMSFDHFADTY